MTGGAPHGDWPVQYECHGCGKIVVPPSDEAKWVPAPAYYPRVLDGDDAE